MKGLLIKDFLVLVKQMKLLLIIIPIIIITGGASFAASIAILIGAALPMTAIGYDEQAKWNELAVMMPYSKKSIVLSKYILGYIAIAVLAVLFTVVISLKSFENGYLMIGFSIVGGLLLIAINTPIMFKFGTQKVRFIYLLFIAVTTALGIVFKDNITNIPTNIINIIPADIINIIPILSIVFVIVLNVISVIISFKIKKNV